MFATIILKERTIFGGILVKVLEKYIEMIAWFNESGAPTPIRFKMNATENDYDYDYETSTIIKVDKILFKEKEKIAGKDRYLYRCQSLINNIESIYELKYELASCRWILYKL